ncbi:APC family permease [Actinoallomurus rhizosphaericola]|uniref:APC family permease n=1 Tax=Actinoallomurus rhizosphaericola TaxID=2952536 RepID=UPI002090DD00|nr:APC family permease [Actinoallomurus rhizosphaericola]MCO5994120.1 APC family permease [Actinoallomurus rhizosphaericola]
MAPSTTGSVDSGRRLRRDVGFWGLMFVSLGSIIGSGWLLGALTAATIAGPASLVSWILAAVMLVILALVHAELGAAYPIAGGTARFPSFAFGPLVGFTAGWMAWVQAVTIAPIEVEAMLSYCDHIGWVRHHITMLHADGTLTGVGLLVATVFMLLFTLINIVGVKLLAHSNGIAVIWKTAIPLLTVVVLLLLTFHASNFRAGGGFMPFGAHGVFAALPAGVVFALQGFEQAIQLAGEARKPQQDVSRAVITATAIGTLVYILLEVAFIGALNPAHIAHGWANPVGKGDFGPYATLAVGAGAAWLAGLLYADAVISPAGTGLVYVAASSRLSYALGREKSVPAAVAKVSPKGVPIVSVIIAFVVGEIAFLPFPSWHSLVGLVTSATAIMYAYGPIALRALRLRDPERNRPYRLPAHRVLAPVAFICANLIIYWSSFQAEWKLGLAILLGLVIFAVTRARTPQAERSPLNWTAAMWVWPWLGGMILIGFLGRYGGSKVLPDWIDVLTVAVFSLAVYFFAVRIAVSSREVEAAVAAEQAEIAAEPELNIA